jgi:hypothetical protein
VPGVTRYTRQFVVNGSDMVITEFFAAPLTILHMIRASVIKAECALVFGGQFTRKAKWHEVLNTICGMPFLWQS